MRGALITCLLLTAACASGDGGVQGDAERELAAFDQQNPNCELWTNWEKMCSRTGPNGETFCKEDPAMRVAASSPFCVVDTSESYYLVWTYTKPQYKSYMRFCAEKSGEKSAHLRGSSEAVATCVGYEKERPFNGYHLEARRHPWCRAWKTMTGNDLLLQEDARDPNRGTIECTETDCSNLSVEDGLSCREDRPPSWCKSVSWMNKWSSSAGYDPNRAVIPAGVYAYFRPDIPVVGTFCRRGI